MKLSKFCEEDLVSFELQATTKNDAIEELVDLAARSTMVRDRDELLNAVLEREKLVTTGVGYGVAFPHAKTRALKGIVIAFARSSGGIDFQAMDNPTLLQKQHSALRERIAACGIDIEPRPSIGIQFDEYDVGM